ncbi:MAG: pilin [Patescibacteria group bacterium]
MKLGLSRKFWKFSGLLALPFFLMIGGILAYSRLQVGADINPNETYDRAGDNFVYYRLSKEDYDKIKANDATAKFIRSNKQLELPIVLAPSAIDDIYDSESKKVERLYDSWKAVYGTYSDIQSAARRERNLVNEGHARRVMQEVSRRLSKSQASYSSYNGFTLYDLSKHVKKAEERQTLNFNIYQAEYDGSADTLKLNANPYLASKIEVNTLTRPNWKNLQKIYKAIMTSAKQRGGNKADGEKEAQTDYQQAEGWSNTIGEALKAKQESNGVYEVVTYKTIDSFLVYKYSKYGLTEEDINNIKNVGHFNGMPIQAWPFFQGDNAVIPREMAANYYISEATTPLTTALAGKILKMYEAVRDASEDNESGGDTSKALASINNLRTYINSYLALKNCGSFDKPYGVNGENFVLCGISGKLKDGRSKAKAISELTERVYFYPFNLVEGEELTLSRQIKRDEVIVIDQKNDEKTWGYIQEIYKFIEDNAGDNLSDKVDAHQSIQTIKDAIKNPTFYAWRDQGSYKWLDIYGGPSGTCKGMNEGEDPNVQVLVNLDKQVQICSISSPGRYEGGKYENARANSKAAALLKEALGKAKSSDDKEIIQRIYDSYMSYALEEWGNDEIKITAPASFRLTKEYIDGRDDKNSNFDKIFRNYGNSVSIPYKVNPNDKILSQVKGGGFSAVLEIISKDSPNYLADTKFIAGTIGYEGEFLWDLNAAFHTSALSGQVSGGNDKGGPLGIGNHQFRITITNSGTIISEATKDFKIFGPNGENDDNQVNGCFGCSISINAPSQIKKATDPDKQAAAMTKIKVRPPLEKRRADDLSVSDVLKLYISPKVGSADDLKNLKEEEWSLKKACTFNKNNKGEAEEFVYTDWPNSDSEAGLHYIRVKTYRGIDIDQLENCRSAFGEIERGLIEAGSTTGLEESPTGETETPVDQPNTNSTKVNDQTDGQSNDTNTDKGDTGLKEESYNSDDSDIILSQLIKQIARGAQASRAKIIADLRSGETLGLTSDDSEEAIDADNDSGEGYTLNEIADLSDDTVTRCTGKAERAITLDPNASNKGCTDPADGSKPICPPDQGGGGGLKPNELIGGSMINSIYELAVRIVEILYWLVMTLSLLALISGGIMYITSGGDTGKSDKAKKVLTYAVTGVIVLILAYALVRLTTSVIIPLVKKG